MRSIANINAGVYAHSLSTFCSLDVSHERSCLLVSVPWGIFYLSGDLVLGTQLTADLGAGQDVLTVLVELELGDDDVGGVETQRDALAAGLVTGDTLDVDNVFETVDGGDLALTALVGATDDGDLVILADGDAADLIVVVNIDHHGGKKNNGKGTNVVLLAQLLAEGGAHDNTTLARAGLEVGRSALAPGRGDVW